MFSVYSIRETTKMICSEFYDKLQHLCSVLWLKTARVCKSICLLVTSFYRFVLLHVNSFAINIFYLLFLSLLGFCILKAIKPRTSFTPRNMDLFFTSVSFITLSSMSTIEMEVFSNSHLVLLTILIFIAGECFTSALGLQLSTSILKNHLKRDETRPPSDENDNVIVVFEDQIELGVLSRPNSKASQIMDPEIIPGSIESLDLEQLKLGSMRLLGFIVLSYLLIVQMLGISMVMVYFSFISSARDILNNKGLNVTTFSIFTTVSTFASCGFIPTNENMMVFRKNSGLLMILTPQVLLGNTLFPSALRLCIRVLGKLKLNASMKMEINYLLQSTSEIVYRHLLPPFHSSFLVMTVLGFILVQFVLFCMMEWSSDSLRGLSFYEKTIGVLFECVNTRHAGQTIVDLSTIVPAILVIFLLMMYLPPYTLFLPQEEKKAIGRFAKERKLFKRGRIINDIMFSQLSFLAIFIILICITEREKIKQDPLNFSIFNIVVEVISAYGNVGFTMGYSCKRQLTPVESCEDKWYGFAGKWSDQGKIILIIIMFFGRLKKYHMNGGKAWILY